MLDLYVLFSPINAVDSEGAPLPTAMVPLTLDDEIQYRCAGYMQAEIERYAELVSEGEEKQPAEEAGSESDDSAVEKPPQKATTSKKRPAQTTKSAEKQSRWLASAWNCLLNNWFDSGYLVPGRVGGRISVYRCRVDVLACDTSRCCQCSPWSRAASALRPTWTCI